MVDQSIAFSVAQTRASSRNAKIILMVEAAEHTTGSDIALGFRVHSGWAALVALAGPASAPLVVERARLQLTDPASSGPFQPYHAAAEMSLTDAEGFLKTCEADVSSRARSSLGDVLVKMRECDYAVGGCGILFGSGRRPGSLAGILSSHAMIHSAEGEFFRAAVVNASEYYELPVIRISECDLWSVAENSIDLPVSTLQKHLAAIGKSIGPPWRQDEKYASLAAWIALAKSVAKTYPQPARS